MKISIITPSYNSKKYIAETIESVIFQKGNFEIEYYIIDGSSNDGTKDIVNTYIEKLKQKSYRIKCNKVYIKLISEKDNGMYDAIVKGFSMITGDIVAYINSDDYYLPNAFSALIAIFEKYENINWITGMNTTYNSHGQIIYFNMPFKYDSNLIAAGVYGTVLPFIQQESTFWRRKIIQFVDLEKLRNLKLAGDFYLWKCFSENNDLYIAQLGLGGFRNRKEQLGKIMKDKYIEEFNYIRTKLTLMDTVKSYLYKFLWYAPGRFKRTFNKNIICFDSNW